MPHRTPTPESEREWATTIAHHDAAITNLSGRMHGVETGLRTLQGEVHSGFANLSNGLSTITSKLDSQPKIDVHKTISSVVTIAVLFSMIVGGIIWVTTAQFSPMIAKQEAFNASISRILDKHDTRIVVNGERLTKVEETVGRWSTSVAVGQGNAGGRR